MSNVVEYDDQDAVKLAESFKKQGYLDKLKNEILRTKTETSGDVQMSQTFEEAVKKTVAETVKQMVSENENMIFKNRGTTSALIETQVLKDEYAMLRNDQIAIDIQKFISDKLIDNGLQEEIENELNKLQDKKENP
ncbi:hypothetical protein C6P45_005214 [Maudiozyma exigua]|uniref:BOD1/SHG1 domain-containing protein n=1 Tax=Maudiozyma exigua TaxID=34358 RepID=A0A9P6WAV6_MAUEX|nr:hypothetical protein C6P45_005214 [Kazachstania exigua]